MAGNPLYDIPGLGGYVAGQQMNEQALNNQLQQAATVQTLQQHFDQMQQQQRVRAALTQSGGDPEKAISAALSAGDAATAHALAPVAAIDQKRKEREQMVEGFRALNNAGAGPNVPPSAENPDAGRQERIARLKQLQGVYANNPTLVASYQKEIDRLSSIKPMVEHNYPIGNDMVQPHISYDEGRTWMPVSGSKPSHKFSQAEPLVAVIGADGNAVLKPRSQASGMKPAAGAELPALEGAGLTSAAAQVASGMPIQQVVPGYGRNISTRRESVRNEAISQIKAQNPGMTDEQAGTELANRQIDFAAGKKSVGQLNTMLGATRQAVDQLDFNVNKVSEAMAKLPSSDLSPVINAIARGVSKWTGDPAYSELFFYMHAAAMESARILQGGQASIAQLHQGAAEEAKKWADANLTTPAAWNQGVAPAMRAEGAERIKTYERAISAQRMRNNPQTPIPASPNEAPAGAAPAAPQYPTATAPNGRKVIFKDGRWQPLTP